MRNSMPRKRQHTRLLQFKLTPLLPPSAKPALLPPRLEGEPTPHRARVWLHSLGPHTDGKCAGAFGGTWGGHRGLALSPPAQEKAEGP